jgi:nucleotide-binding universal stress UspA family protein
VSKQRQKKAQALAKAAREREQNARERARRNQEHGDPEMARLHDHAAELHADAASDAETLIELDRQIEGDQLGED